MRVDSIELFYLRMPEVLDVGDGSQDALLVRVRSGRWTGWGECEASPLASIAAFAAPMSHSACKPVAASVLGETIETPEDIRRINRSIRCNSADLLQADHTLSGIDIALWDLLGKRLEEPVWRLLGFAEAFPKRPYASALFGKTPSESFVRARTAAQEGFWAVKLGWGPFGRDLAVDREHVAAAREAIGSDRLLMIDAGTVWGDDVEAATARLPILREAKVHWLEEPFPGSELTAYRELSRKGMPIAGGENCHSAAQARAMIDLAGLTFLQIDAGRVGGITAGHEAALHAAARNVSFVNHTFTSALALCASLQPCAGLSRDALCELPADPSPLAKVIGAPLSRGADGLLRLPEATGIGVDVDVDLVAPYLVETEIRLQGKLLFRSDRASLLD